MFPIFGLYSKAAVNKTVWYQYRKRHIGIESPKVNPCRYGQLNYDTKVQAPSLLTKTWESVFVLEKAVGTVSCTYSFASTTWST